MDLKDVWGHSVNLTDARKAHLLEHPEMKGQEDKLAETLLEPDVVIRSRTDNTIGLFYRFYKKLTIGDKHLCVVVKYIDKSGSIITAYFTDKVKKGDGLWKT